MLKQTKCMCVVALVIGLVACNHVDTLSDTANNAGYVAANDDSAPPYEEIESTIVLISGNYTSPLPEVQLRQLEHYQQSLVGKKVVDWTGWVLDVSPDKEYFLAMGRGFFRERPFMLWVAMHEPTPNELTEDNVHIDNVTEEQAEMFKAWGDPVYRDRSWQKVHFSGVINSVYAWTTVGIDPSILEPIDHVVTPTTLLSLACP